MNKIPYALLLSLLVSANSFSANASWSEDFENNPLKRWRSGMHGGVDARISEDTQKARSGKSSIKVVSNSPLAPHVWTSLTSFKKVPVPEGGDITLHCHVAGEEAGRAFASVVFSPSGGETRVYLPTGNFSWTHVAQDIQVPRGATQAQVRFGIESHTKALWLDDVSITPPASPRTNLTANFKPRPHPRVFPQASEPSGNLVSLDVRGLMRDELHLAVTLQGIINQKQPRVYLYHNERDFFWADWLLDQKYVQSIQKLSSLKELVAMFREEIPGVIVYDGKLPATRHVATMIGSVRGAPASSSNIAKKYKLPVLENLSGRWTKNVDAYRYVWENYRGQMASHILAIHHPEMTQQGPRDYFAQQRIFTFWISGYQDSHEPGADPYEEMSFAHEVFAATPPNIPVMGWWSLGDVKGISEYDGVRLGSSYAKFTSGSEFNTNLSVLSGIRVPGDTFRQSTHITEKNIGPLQKKLYVTLSVIDSGDSQWYWQHYQHVLWQDGKRGEHTVNWSINPTTIDIMPPVVAWFYKNATPKDYLYCAITGLGYMNPTVYASRFKDSDKHAIWTSYAKETARYMDDLDLKVLGIYAGSFTEPRNGMPPIYKYFAENNPNLIGILSDFGRHEGSNAKNALEYTINDIPVFHTLMRWIQWSHTDGVAAQRQKEDASINFTAKELLDNAPGQRPAVMSGLILSWTMAPRLVKQVVEKLPKDIEPVRADELVVRERQLRAE